jgi:Fic family protein
MQGVGGAASWPPLRFEEHAWASTFRREDLSRRQWESMQGTYRAAIVPHIAEQRVGVSAAVAAEADEASTLLTRFDSELGASILPFASILLRSESASSSQIENLTSGARAIAETEIGERDTGNASLIVRNVRAMQAALDLSDTIDSASIIAMHAALLSDHAPSITGSYRSEQVWIGGSSVSPHEATFVPPHHGRVEVAMADLLNFIERRDIPALTHAAIAHAHFETIHPFPDGNGRTGRALVQAMVRGARLTTNVTVPLSAGLLHDVSSYYSALDAYRQGDVDSIVSAFSDAAGFAVRNGRGLVADIGEIRGLWDDALTGLRSDHSARRIASLAIENPVLNAPLVQRRLDLSVAASYRALETLSERGILKPGNSRQRNRIWIAERVLTALDAFAGRAARRAHAL